LVIISTGTPVEFCEEMAGRERVVPVFSWNLLSARTDEGGREGILGIDSNEEGFEELVSED
jgi:hypothetical protein